jgi:hypothetical protein
MASSPFLKFDPLLLLFILIIICGATVLVTVAQRTSSEASYNFDAWHLIKIFTIISAAIILIEIAKWGMRRLPTRQCLPRFGPRFCITVIPSCRRVSEDADYLPNGARWTSYETHLPQDSDLRPIALYTELSSDTLPRDPSHLPRPQEHRAIWSQKSFPAQQPPSTLTYPPNTYTSDQSIRNASQFSIFPPAKSSISTNMGRKESVRASERGMF